MSQNEVEIGSCDSSSRMISLEPENWLDEADLGQLVSLVHRHSGIALQPRNQRVLQRVVSKRMFRLGIESAREYIELVEVEQGRKELHELVTLLTVQKTAFFRDRPQFDLLQGKVLPELVSTRPDATRPVRIWSAGCSTGEEPYSIAMLLRRNLPVGVEARVLGTDISVLALNRAKSGRYRKTDLVPLRPEERSLLQPRSGFWSPRDDVRTLVQFEVHNLVSVPFPTPPVGLWDVIFCRNVLIYFSHETVRETICRFHGVLRPGGYLFLGVSESLFELAEGFELTTESDAFVYRKLTSAPTKVHPPRPVSKPVRQRVSKPTPPPPPAAQPAPRPASQTARPVSVLVELEKGLRDAEQDLRANRQDDAFQRLFALTGKYPREIEPYMMLGQLAADRGSPEEALSWYQVATETQPLNIEARFVLSVILYRTGRFLEASEELRKLLFLEGDFVLGHYYLGVVALRLGDLDTSLRSFRNVLLGARQSLTDKTEGLFVKHQITLDALTAASRAMLEQLGQAAVDEGSLDR